MLSVIIVTKNRDTALKDISLPSLLRQDMSNFEVIVWDASDTEKTSVVVDGFAAQFESKGISLRYFIAPRAGITSQRNDAISAARGDILFFIDDDSEVSPNGLSVLEECFINFPDCMGAGLELTEEGIGKEDKLADKIKEKLYAMIGYVKKRKVHPSGSQKGMTAPPGPAEWLSGCSMAFRREVFDSMKFNEKLEAFGGYAMSEDVEFSHRVFLNYRTPLQVPEGGYVRHFEVPEGRQKFTETKIAMLFYNRYLVLKVASIRAPIYGKIAFAWNILRRFISTTFRQGFSNTKNGFVLAIRQIRKDREKLGR